LCGVNFNFDDKAFESHHGAGIDACKHEGSVSVDGEKSIHRRGIVRVFIKSKNIQREERK
jgi:hypothetical protein